MPFLPAGFFLPFSSAAAVISLTSTTIGSPFSSTRPSTSAAAFLAARSAFLRSASAFFSSLVSFLANSVSSPVLRPPLPTPIPFFSMRSRSSSVISESSSRSIAIAASLAARSFFGMSAGASCQAGSVCALRAARSSDRRRTREDAGC